jgi:deoxyribodipyrimidine photo-lyase
VAGCGTDPAPYFRVFNPITQSEKFDPDGTYIRRYVPELVEVPNQHLHQPWLAPDGLPAGYPGPIVDHAAERKEALRRYAEIKS